MAFWSDANARSAAVIPLSARADPPQTHTTFGEHVVPGIVFMRGGAVSILPILQCDGQRHVLLCRQPRLPVGLAQFPEIPAGMLDGSGKFSGVAAKELEEETGIVIRDDQV